MVHVIMVAVNIQFYDTKMIMLSIFFQSISSISFTTFFVDGCATAALCMLLTYYEHLRMNKINYHVMSVYDSKDTTEVHRAVKAFTEEHNLLCAHINVVNRFWKNLLLTLFITMLPANLIVMHQLLFEDIPLHLRFFYVVCILCLDSILFGLQYSFAQFSKKVHSMYAKLSRLQWCLKGTRMKIKLKLNMCFESLTNKRKIGFQNGLDSIYNATFRSGNDYFQIIINLEKKISSYN